MPPISDGDPHTEDDELEREDELEELDDDRFPLPGVGKRESHFLFVLLLSVYFFWKITSPDVSHEITSIISPSVIPVSISFFPTILLLYV
jgi:hypothetical protein